MESAAASGASPELATRLKALEERLDRLGDVLEIGLDRALSGLEFLVDDIPRGRTDLAALRASAEYEEAFTDPDPLVSVIVPTWNRTESLVTRAIPSLLAQTHENVEVIVVGDCAPPELCEAVAAIEDPRLCFDNLTVRGPYDDDPYRAWCAFGIPARNVALARARGRWITMLDDDDEFPPEFVERMLTFAQARRLEFVYGGQRFLDPDGSTRVVTEFPPRFGYTSLQSALWHAGLRFIEFELAHAALEVPQDWGFIRRLMRLGVTMGCTEDIIVDYAPSGVGDLGPSRPRRSEETPGLRGRLADLEVLANHLERERAALASQVTEAKRRDAAARAELERRLEEVRRSRSWRLTAPLRVSAELRRRWRDAQGS